MVSHQLALTPTHHVCASRKSPINLIMVRLRYIQITSSSKYKPLIFSLSNSYFDQYFQVGAEWYGGGIWNTWFDRDLKLAGRALVRESNGAVNHKLVHIDRPVLRIPNLCIHLNRGVNDGFGPNKETEMVPILAQMATHELNKDPKERIQSLNYNQIYSY